MLGFFLCMCLVHACEHVLAHPWGKGGGKHDAVSSECL